MVMSVRQLSKLTLKSQWNQVSHQQQMMANLVRANYMRQLLKDYTGNKNWYKELKDRAPVWRRMRKFRR